MGQDASVDMGFGLRIGIRDIIAHRTVGVAETLGGGVHDDAEGGEDCEDSVHEVQELLLQVPGLARLLSPVYHDHVSLLRMNCSPSQAGSSRSR